jgi:hypothetical protein
MNVCMYIDIRVYKSMRVEALVYIRMHTSYVCVTYLLALDTFTSFACASMPVQMSKPYVCTHTSHVCVTYLLELDTFTSFHVQACLFRCLSHMYVRIQVMHA